MPELPEVETTKRGIEPHILSQTIEKFSLMAPKLRWPIPTSLQTDTIGQQVLSVSRRAKYLLINLANGSIILHLGMSGKLKILDTNADLVKHDHIEILFSNNKVLRLNDPRRFGAVLWTDNADPLQHALFTNLGPEPLSTEFSAKYLFAQLQTKKQKIKKLLMDAKIVVGVGNIYASEVLFASAIHPLTPGNTITLAQCKLLASNIKSILKKSIAKGGTTLKDFLDSNGKPGYFSQELKVYGRAQQPCRSCQQPIESLVIEQRNTFFCNHCQS
jgi:formamidopyrimidine-DNA glycosylase